MNTEPTANQTATDITRTVDVDRVMRAFKSLRNGGYIARGGERGYKCCGGCGGSQIATDVARMTPAKRAKVRGAVFYSSQDAEAFGHKGRKLHISYGKVSCHDLGEFGDDTVAVGEALATALRAEGLKVEWNGDASETVKVLP